MDLFVVQCDPDQAKLRMPMHLYDSEGIVICGLKV